MSKNVVVIGGGIIGLSTAYYLHKEGHQVTVIDKSDFSGGASFVNAGYITPSHIIPLAAPGIASIAIFCFIISWTEYLFASILISTDSLKTLPVGLATIVGQYQIDWGFLLAGAVLASLPVIILFVFIGKYFVSGLTEGAVK